MRETNAWWIRKVRWIAWIGALYIPISRNTHWDYHARRVAWGAKLQNKTEEEQREEAEAQKANWGYNPRYEPVYEHSLKKEKYARQTRLEAVLDTPRVKTNARTVERHGVTAPKDVRTLTMIAREHNRVPGMFDYNFPQEFYSTFPEIDADAYVTVGAPERSRKVSF